MTNKCSGCGAMLAADQMQCPFCNTVQTDNSNEALLDRLMSVKRKYEVALNQGDRMILEQLLADGFVNTLVDGGDPETCDRKRLIEWSGTNARSFFSYSFSSEKLLERTDDAAKVSCIDMTCRHYEKDNFLFPNGENNEYARTKIDFAHRAGHWQIAAIHETTIDEEGNDC